MLSDKLFLTADHPEQAARQVAGLIAPGEKFGAEALRTAAAAALSANVHSHAYVREWLASGRTILTSEPASSGAGYHLMDGPGLWTAQGLPELLHRL